MKNKDSLFNSLLSDKTVPGGSLCKDTRAILVHLCRKGSNVKFSLSGKRHYISLFSVFFVAYNGWMVSFLCCTLVVTSEETGKENWIHHYICNFIAVQRKQPLQHLAAAQVVLFITRD